MSKRNYIVIGLGRFGMSVAKKLSEYNCEVLAVDENMELVENASRFVTHAVKADVHDPEDLKALSLNNFDVAIIAIGSNLEASIMAALIVKESGVPKIIAKAKNDTHKKILEKIGVDFVVQPEEEMGIRLANNLVRTNIIEMIDFSDEYRIVEIKALKDWENKKLQDLNLRVKYGINVLCVKGDGEEFNISPDLDYIIKKGDILIVIAENKKSSLLGI